jgi:hypothetical protein
MKRISVIPAFFIFLILYLLSPLVISQTLNPKITVFDKDILLNIPGLNNHLEIFPVDQINLRYINNTAFAQGECEKVYCSIYQKWLYNNWKITSRNICYYDSLGLPYKSTGQAWYDDGRIIYTQTLIERPDSNTLIYLMQIWDGTNWNNNNKCIFTYFIQNDQWLCTEKTIFIWSDNIWKNQKRWLYTYDFLGDVLTEIVQDGEGNSWLNY